jgi:hypothetical protein
MSTFKVAHIKEQGENLIIILLNPSFGNKLESEQQHIRDTLQMCATDAGLAGTAIPVWEDAARRMCYFAPKPWHPFFGSIDMAYIVANINRTLTCNA